MAITERAVGHGGGTLKLSSRIPAHILHRINPGDFLTVTSHRAPVQSFGSIGPRSAGRWTGPIIDVDADQSSVNLTLSGAAELLGSPNGEQGAQSTQKGTLVGSADAALAIALEWGTVNPLGLPYPSYVEWRPELIESFFGAMWRDVGAGMTRHELVEAVAAWFDRFWTIDMTRAKPALRFGTPAYLWGDPIVMTRKQHRQVDRRTAQWLFAARKRSLRGHITRMTVAGPDISFPSPPFPAGLPSIPNKGWADRSTPYRAPDGQQWHQAQFLAFNGISLPGFVFLLADTELGRRNRAGTSVEVTLDRYDIAGQLHAAGLVKIFDPEDPRLVDFGENAAEHDAGQWIRPRTLMVDSLTWEPPPESGVYIQYGTQTAIDVTPWVETSRKPAKATLGEPVRGVSGMYDLWQTVRDLRQVREQVSS